MNIKGIKYIIYFTNLRSLVYDCNHMILAIVIYKIMLGVSGPIIFNFIGLYLNIYFYLFIYVQINCIIITTTDNSHVLDSKLPCHINLINLFIHFLYKLIVAIEYGNVKPCEFFFLHVMHIKRVILSLLISYSWVFNIIFFPFLFGQKNSRKRHRINLSPFYILITTSSSMCHEYELDCMPTIRTLK